MPDNAAAPNTTIAAEPNKPSTAPVHVHGTPYDRNQPEPGIALCLSGGGYRG